MIKSISSLFILGLFCINAQAEDKITNLSSVMVTAQKQEENAQNIPVSIEVLNEFQIEDKNISSIIDLADSVPNFMIFNNGMSAVNTPVMRGVFSHIETGLVATGLYIDGVPTISASTFETDFLNIKRVEVLKGPQSTLYGKSATMGVVNIITKEPKEDAFSINTDFASDKYRNISANITKLLLEDKLMLSISAKKEEKEGYIKNTYKNDYENDRSKTYSKVDLKYNFNDRNSLKLNYSRTKYDDGGFNMVLFGQKDVSSGVDTFNKAKNESMYIKYMYDFNENLSLTSLTSNFKSKQDEQTDYDFSPYAITDYYNKSLNEELTQEFKINYKNEKLKLVSGLFLSKTDEHTLTNTDISDYVGVPFIDVKDRRVDSKSYALFSQLDYQISEDLSLIIGARYEKYKKDFEDKNNNINLSNDWSNISPKIALQYILNENSNIYGTIAKGYKSGGYNPFVPNGSSSKYYKFDDESLISYEMGSKNILLNNKLILNAAIFYMTMKDMQVQESVNSSSSYITNAAKASGKGFEIDLDYKITEGIYADLGVGYSDVTFDEFVDSSGSYEGNQNPYSPKYNYNLGLSYRATNGFYSNINLNGYGKIYLDKKNKYSRNAYKIVNTKIGYETENFDIYLYGKNIFDKTYDAQGYFSGYYTLLSPPRQVGVQLKYRF